jgi:ABC-type multidrug transport system fused ATPase/permease subunit
LDPFEENTDECIWEALEKAHLKETIRRFDGGLEYEIGEGGSNLRFNSF